MVIHTALRKLWRVISLADRDLSYLKTAIGWICFCFPDDTYQYFRTTLSPEILGEEARFDKPGYIFNLDKMKWVRIPKDSDVKVKITDSRPDLGELAAYVNKFI